MRSTLEAQQAVFPGKPMLQDTKRRNPAACTVVASADSYHQPSLKVLDCVDHDPRQVVPVVDTVSPRGDSEKPRDEANDLNRGTNACPQAEPEIIWGKLDAYEGVGKILVVHYNDAGEPYVRAYSPAEFSEIEPNSPRIIIKKRWYVPVTVNAQGGEFLIDIGATTTLITKKFYDSLTNPPPMIPSKVVVGVASVGGTVTTEGMATFPIRIGRNIYMLTCLIVGEIAGNEDGVIGADFYYVHACNLDWSGRFTLENGKSIVTARPKKGHSDLELDSCLGLK